MLIAVFVLFLKKFNSLPSFFLSLQPVTEREIVEGILKTPDPAKHCLWFNRQIKDIESAPMSKTVSRYYGKLITQSSD